MKDKLVQADLFFVVRAASGDSSQVSTGPLAGEASASHEEREPCRSAPEQFLAADTAFALSALQLGSLESLAANLGTAGDWSARTRIARAYRAGLSAREVLEGQDGYPVSSIKLEVKNKFYICLRSSAFPQGFAATSYRDFLRGCPKEASGQLEAGKVSVTRLEVERSAQPTSADDSSCVLGISYAHDLESGQTGWNWRGYNFLWACYEEAVW